MKPLASPSLQSARLIVAVAALLMTVGSATAAAAPDHAGHRQAQALGVPARPGQVPKFTWHTLKLLNGWKSAAVKGYQSTGTPAWAIRDGVVYLRGAVKQPDPDGSVALGRLPKAARPASKLYIQVFTDADTTGVLYIGSGGTMLAYEGSAFTFTSLSTVSYPTAAVKSRRLTLENGWQSSQSIYQTGNPSYAVSKGVVYLSGSLHGGSSQLAFVLPKAARPAHRMYVSVYTSDGNTGGLVIQRSGKVDVDGPVAAMYTSLADISFPVVSTQWHDFKLTAGWKSAAADFGTAAPAYAIVNGVVYFTGSVRQVKSSSSAWTTSIPAAARPVSALQIAAYTSGGYAGAVSIGRSDGLASSVPPGNAEAFTSLAAISYPPSS
jgi:hypothetical protein